MPTPTENKFVAVILASFRGSVGGAWSDGMLNEKMIRAIINGIAFELVNDQDETTDLRRVFVKIEAARTEATTRVLAGDVGKGHSFRAKPVFGR